MIFNLLLIIPLYYHLITLQIIEKNPATLLIHLSLLIPQIRHFILNGYFLYLAEDFLQTLVFYSSDSLVLLIFYFLFFIFFFLLRVVLVIFYIK